MVEIASHKHGVLTGRIVRVEPDVVFPDELQIEELVPDIAVEAVIPHQQLHRLPAVHNCSFQCLYLRRVLHADRLKAAGCQLTVSGLKRSLHLFEEVRVVPVVSVQKGGVPSFAVVQTCISRRSDPLILLMKRNDAAVGLCQPGHDLAAFVL